MIQLAQELSKENLDKLVSLVSERLGKSPQSIKDNVTHGNVKNIVSGLPQSQQAQLQELLKDPERARKVIASPQAQLVLQTLFGKQK